MPFAYDADGNRVKAVYGTTTVYTPFPDYELTVSGGTETIRTTYRLAGQIVAVRTGTGAINHVAFDHLGSVGALFNSSGVYIGTSLSRFDPLGNFRTKPLGSNPTITTHGFTGHRHNNTTHVDLDLIDLGLIYMNARYYLPEVGRFISPDTIVPEPGKPQSYNRYSYVNNSPMNYIDPTGHNRDCGMGDPVCNGDRSFMAGGWGSLPQQDFVSPMANYYASGFTYAPGQQGERSNAVGGGDVHNGEDLKSDTTTAVVALSTGTVRVADRCTVDPCNGIDSDEANMGAGSVVIVEYPYEVVPDRIREEYGMTSDMSLYVQYQHLDEIAPNIGPGRVVTPNDRMGEYGNTGLSRGAHLHFESHVGPSQALGIGRVDGAYDSLSNIRNWHNLLDLVDPNVILDNLAQ